LNSKDNTHRELTNEATSEDLNPSPHGTPPTLLRLRGTREARFLA